MCAYACPGLDLITLKHKKISGIDSTVSVYIVLQCIRRQFTNALRIKRHDVVKLALHGKRRKIGRF